MATNFDDYVQIWMMVETKWLKVGTELYFMFYSGTFFFQVAILQRHFMLLLLMCSTRR